MNNIIQDNRYFAIRNYSAYGNIARSVLNIGFRARPFRRGLRSEKYTDSQII
jgi:hypothetical protein